MSFECFTFIKTTCFQHQYTNLHVSEMKIMKLYNYSCRAKDESWHPKKKNRLSRNSKSCKNLSSTRHPKLHTNAIVGNWENCQLLRKSLECKRPNALCSVETLVVIVRPLWIMIIYRVSKTRNPLLLREFLCDKLMACLPLFSFFIADNSYNINNSFKWVASFTRECQRQLNGFLYLYMYQLSTAFQNNSHQISTSYSYISRRIRTQAIHKLWTMGGL